MSWDDPGRYDETLAKALATPCGHLDIGRGGFALHYENSRLSGYDCDFIKWAAIAAGLPVIDSRMISFELAVSGPMNAVNGPAGRRPWHALSFAPLGAVAAVYRKAGAEVFHISEDPENDGVFDVMPPGPEGQLIDFWLNYVRARGS
jgi:hypothetical protein